jgi:O-antigen ligase
VDQLTNKDINNIEWGMTNYIFENKYSFYSRIYTAFWELYSYHHGANPTGFSISQRIESLKNTSHIIKKRFWFGVGTGDVFKAVKEQYKADNSPLSVERQIAPHDQWITFFMTFGLPGFLIIVFSLFAPIFIEHKAGNYLFILIMLIGFLSFFDEDTLNTHVGISFFAFFYSLFLFRENT